MVKEALLVIFCSLCGVCSADVIVDDFTQGALGNVYQDPPGNIRIFYAVPGVLGGQRWVA
jgi:hypothetical protein